MSTPRVAITGSNPGIGLGLVGIDVPRGDRVFACCRQPSDGPGDRLTGLGQTRRSLDPAA
jgi:NAD(P)-dependent dehydrogenase (short-subunit alcohol dehydrogenase family)